MNATPLSMAVGKNAEWEFTATKEDGSVLDLTGATVRFRAKDSFSDPDSAAILTKTATITSPATGKCEVRLVPADTSALAVPRVLRWDLQALDVATKQWRLAYGQLTIHAVVGQSSP